MLVGDSPDLEVHVAFDCSPLQGSPAEMWGVRVYGHTGNANILAVRRAPSGSYSAFGIQLLPKESRSFSVQLTRPDAVAQNAAMAFETARAAFAATVTAGFPETPGAKEELHLRPVTTAFSPLFEEVHIQDQEGAALSRRWDGYPGNDQPQRLAIDLAWDALERSVPQKFVVRSPEEGDKRLLAEVWGREEYPSYAEVALLHLAQPLGSLDLLDRLVPRLRSRSEEVRSAAVDAIATITNWDVRAFPDGGVRPLEDVVSDYDRECAR